MFLTNKNRNPKGLGVFDRFSKQGGREKKLGIIVCTKDYENNDHRFVYIVIRIALGTS